ncbi:TetR/AcrR family transcriptional regulator [Pseudohoeflea suaedae]|uniref:TetR/AcrR family transcriptional regulator n=1 Tax=Pseudohoeflea suaedae TaxID=877384 RepID=A0A4V3A7B0_9HYPH|nr:TetR/AcrR family transcriptional regulator [Pseudohoeflea suaedae]TDH37995.1 TetR/AcrR family transcriptional regulator [Pseudohoeflea suaedae]
MSISNKARSEAMRRTLVEAARSLFVEKGYADTATPDIVARAGVTRGAMYHHFEDKKALFRAVVEHEAAAVAAAIDDTPFSGGNPREALLEGTRRYFDAMTSDGRTRLMLLDGPSVLGWEAIRELDERTAESRLRAGLEELLDGTPNRGKADELAMLLSAAFDRAALAIAGGADRRSWERAILALIDGLAA